MFSDNKVNSMSYLFRRRWWSPADVSERLQWPLVKVHSSFITLLRRRCRRRLSVFSFTIHTWLCNYRRRVWGKIEKKDKSWNKKTVFAWILCSRTFRADVFVSEDSIKHHSARKAAVPFILNTTSDVGSRPKAFLIITASHCVICR